VYLGAKRRYINTLPFLSFSFLLSNLNVLVAICKGMQAVKLCSNKVLQFLAGVPANIG